MPTRCPPCADTEFWAALAAFCDKFSTAQRALLAERKDREEKEARRRKRVEQTTSVAAAAVAQQRQQEEAMQRLLAQQPLLPPSSVDSSPAAALRAGAGEPGATVGDGTPARPDQNGALSPRSGQDKRSLQAQQKSAMMQDAERRMLSMLGMDAGAVHPGGNAPAGPPAAQS